MSALSNDCAPLPDVKNAHRIYIPTREEVWWGWIDLFWRRSTNPEYLADMGFSEEWSWRIDFNDNTLNVSRLLSGVWVAWVAGELDHEYPLDGVLTFPTKREAQAYLIRQLRPHLKQWFSDLLDGGAR